MSKFKGALAPFAFSTNRHLFIKPRPDCFDGKFYAVGYYARDAVPTNPPNFIELVQYSRERDAKRALRNIGYVQEGNRWVHASSILVRQEETT